MPIKIRLPADLPAWREERGLTQDNVVKILRWAGVEDVSGSTTIGMWETGKRAPSLAQWERIRSVLNDWLPGDPK